MFFFLIPLRFFNKDSLSEESNSNIIKLADFKKHFSWGIFLGVIFVVAGLIYSFLSGVELALLVFLAVLIGSFLPDIDLDDGIPFQLLFGTLGLVFGGTAFYQIYQAGEENFLFLTLAPIGGFIFIRFLLGFVFKKSTHHRGIFHSIPAAFLLGLILIYFLRFFELFSEFDLLIGFALFVGYIGHLLLDEIYSSINIQGFSFKTKKSLGSALKFYSSSKPVSFVVYFLILIFLFLIF